MQGQPTDAKEDDDNNEHLDDLLLVSQQRLVPLVLGIAGGLAAPQLDGHLDVNEADYAEGDNELDGDQNETIDSHVVLGEVGSVAEPELCIEVLVVACWKGNLLLGESALRHNKNILVCDENQRHISDDKELFIRYY